MNRTDRLGRQVLQLFSIQADMQCARYFDEEEPSWMQDYEDHEGDEKAGDLIGQTGVQDF